MVQCKHLLVVVLFVLCLGQSFDMFVNGIYTVCYEKESTDSTSCSGIGTCVANNTCTCDAFLATGSECEIMKCAGKLPSDPTVCDGRGVCDSGDCICATQPFGSSTQRGLKCDTPHCFVSQIDPINFVYECGGHGTCIDVNVCQCQIGYGGYDCTKTDFNCFGLNATQSNVCSGRGQCIDQDYCLCQSDYGGKECSIPKCNDFLATDVNVCSGRGQCIGVNQCSCQLGFNGINCEKEQGKIAIVSCFGIISNESDTVCSGKGSCLGNDYCSCKLGYTGSNCNETFCYGILQSSEKVCSGNGHCIGLNSCSCSNGSPNNRRVGDECEILQCPGIDLQFYNASDVRVCSGRGECRDKVGCVCRDGFYGDSCQVSSCFSVFSNQSNSCNGNGICKDLDSCECFSNSSRGFWTGDDCSTCSISYGGSNCSVELECHDSNICLGLGECAVDNSCSCDSSFDGTNCEECAPNHYGPLCEVFCSAELNCSSHGVCSRDGFCECHQSRELGYFQSFNCSKCLDGYFGLDCSTFIGSNFTFNKYGNEILLKVIPPLFINIPQTESQCKTYFSTQSQLILGNEFTCQWTNVYYGDLKIFIPRNATVVPGDILEFNVYAFEKVQHVALYKNIVSLASDVINIITPYPNIEILTSYSSGTSIDIIGRNLISIQRERPLYYEWSVLNSDLINNYVNSKSGLEQSSITIPGNFTKSTLKLKLRIANYFQQYGTEKIITLQDGASSTSTAKQVFFKISSLRNPMYILLDILPYKFNTQFTINGEKPTNISESGYRIEWSLSPDLGLASSGLSLITLQPSSDNSSVLFTSDDTVNYEFYSVPYTLFNVTANLYHDGYIISSDSLLIHFNLYESKSYDITISKSLNDQEINSQYPLIISLTIPPLVVIKSIEWSCVSEFMYNGICHDQYRAIIAQSANKTSIELSKSAVFLHYNIARFYAKITTSVGIQYKSISVIPSAAFKVFYAHTETGFMSSGYVGPFRLYSLHGTLFSFEYRLFDSTEPLITAAGDAPATTGTVTAYNVYDNSPITLGAANGVTTYTDTYRTGPTNYAKKVKVDMTKFSAPIYFQVKLTYKTLEMNVRQYLIIGTVPKEIVNVSMTITPIVKYPEMKKYTFQITNSVQHAFYEPIVTLTFRYRNSTSMAHLFYSIPMFDLFKEISIALPPLIDEFTIYKKVTYYSDSWVTHEKEQNKYIYEDEVASFPASSLSSDPIIKAMQLRIRTSFEKGKTDYIANVINKLLGL